MLSVLNRIKMKKIIKIVLIATSIIIVALISLLYFLFGTKSELVKIKNENLNETIYLKQYVRGLNYELNVISTKRLFSEPDINKEVVGMDGYPYFYKFSLDTLYIYGSSWENIDDNIFKTHIVFKELSNDDYLLLSRDHKYKELGFKYFPPSQEKFVDN